MKTALIHFRKVRPESHVVEVDGVRVGQLVQEPANKEGPDAGRFRFWPIGQAPSPSFRNLDEAKGSIAEILNCQPCSPTAK